MKHHSVDVVVKSVENRRVVLSLDGIVTRVVYEQSAIHAIARSEVKTMVVIQVGY